MSAHVSESADTVTPMTYHAPNLGAGSVGAIDWPATRLSEQARADVDLMLAEVISAYRPPCVMDMRVVREQLGPIARKYGLPGVDYARERLRSIIDGGDQPSEGG